jgi:predicted nuclease with TOPRIM domain
MQMDFLKDLELPDDVKGQLQEKMQEFTQAQIDEHVQGLKAKNEELLAEKRRVQQEKEKIDAEAKAERERIAAENGQFKELYESQKEEANQLRSTIEQMNQAVAQQKVQGEASRLASSLTKDTARAQLLEKEISQRLQLVDGEIKVVDESGQLTVSTLDDLSATIKQSYPFLVDGSQAQGGGAARSQGGADVGAREMSRDDFEQMNPAKKAEFMKSGGKLVD